MLLHLWWGWLLHLWLNVITFMVGSVITFMVKCYYIYGGYYIWSLLHLWVIHTCHRLAPGVDPRADQGDMSGNSRGWNGFFAPGQGEIQEIVSESVNWGREFATLLNHGQQPRGYHGNIYRLHRGRKRRKAISRSLERVGRGESGSWERFGSRA